MPRVVLRLAYDGTGYCGWQTQSNRQSLQDDLELALSQIALEKVRVFCAGRTDASVHALSQIVHFDTEANRPLTAWVKGVNRCLSELYAQPRHYGLGRMMVRNAQQTSTAFHARFSATSRTYFYVIYNDVDWHPHWVNRSGFYYRSLDLPAMQEAALALEGCHDFSAFRAAECQAKSPIRTIQYLKIKTYPPFLLAQIQADGFLHHMIRNIIGALLAIGSGDEPVARMRQWLLAGERSLLPPTFAASGLYFAGAQYPPTILSFPTLCGHEEILPGLA